MFRNASSASRALGFVLTVVRYSTTRDVSKRLSHHIARHLPNVQFTTGWN